MGGNIEKIGQLCLVAWWDRRGDGSLDCPLGLSPALTPGVHWQFAPCL